MGINLRVTAKRYLLYLVDYFIHKNPITITDLPREVLLEIFMQIDLEDQIRLANTCKLMNNTFHYHSNGHNLFQDNRWKLAFKHNWIESNEKEALLKLIKLFKPEKKYPIYYLINLLNKLSYEYFPWFDADKVLSPYHIGLDKRSSYAYWFKKGHKLRHYDPIFTPTVKHLVDMWGIIEADHCYGRGGNCSVKLSEKYQPRRFNTGYYRYDPTTNCFALTDEGKSILKLLSKYTQKCVVLYLLYKEIITSSNYQYGNANQTQWRDLKDDDLLQEIIKTSSILQKMKIEIEENILDQKNQDITSKLRQ